MATHGVPHVIAGLQTPNSRIFSGATPSTSTTYNDSGSGTITLSGTSTESFAVKPPKVLRSNAFSYTQNELGSRVFKAPTVYYDSGSGTVTLSGTSSESFAVVPPKTVQGKPTVDPLQKFLESRIYTQVAAAPIVYNDSGSGTITLSGTSVESFATAGFHVVQAGSTGSVVRATQTFSYALADPRSVVLEGAVPVSTGSFDDSGSGTITLSGSGVESYRSGFQPRVLVAGQADDIVSAVDNSFRFEPKDPVPQTFLYYNAAPPIYRVIFPGSTNQGFQFETYKPADREPTLPNNKVIRPPFAQGTSFNDSGAGQITLSGTRSDLFSASDSRTGIITLSGFGNENFQGASQISNIRSVDPNLVQHLISGVR